MPRRSMLTAADRENLLALPESDDELIRHYPFSETDRALIRLRRGDANRLGFAVQLCLLRYPGHALAADREVPDVLIHWVAKELWLDATVWADYGERAKHAGSTNLTLRAYLVLAAFTRVEFRRLVRALTDTALQIDKGIVLATRAVEIMRQHQVVIPPIMAIDRACSQALTLANRRDMVFGLFWLLGYQFSPRLADAGEDRFWRVDREADYGPLTYQQNRLLTELC